MTRRIFGRTPKDEPWFWLSCELVCSDAWRAMGINARRLLDFLLVEHRKHAGLENRNLKAPYDQLEVFGVTRSEIRGAIEDFTQRLYLMAAMRVRLDSLVTTGFEAQDEFIRRLMIDPTKIEEALFELRLLEEDLMLRAAPAAEGSDGADDGAQ